MTEDDDDGFVSRGAERRGRIAAAAQTVLAAAGIGGLTMQAVADAAGLKKSVVLYHVGDRPGLIRLLTARVVAQRAALDAPLTRVAGDPRQLLTEWLAGQFAALTLDESPVRLAWLLRLDTAVAVADPAQSLAGAPTLDRLGQLLSRGHAEAYWHAPDAQGTAWRVKALVDGFLLQALEANDEEAAVRRLRGTCRSAVLDALVR